MKSNQMFLSNVLFNCLYVSIYRIKQLSKLNKNIIFLVHKHNIQLQLNSLGDNIGRCAVIYCGKAAGVGIVGIPFVKTRFISSPEHCITSTTRFLFACTMVRLVLLNVVKVADSSESICIKASPEGSPLNKINKLFYCYKMPIHEKDSCLR